MLQALWKPLLILILVDVFLSSEGKDSSNRNLRHTDNVQNEGIYEKKHSKIEYGKKIFEKISSSGYNKPNMASNLDQNILDAKLFQENSNNAHERNGLEYDLNLSKKKDHHSGNIFLRKRQDFKPLIDLKRSKFNIYVLKPNELSENTIKEITGSKKTNGIPQCSKLHYETVEKWNYLENIKEGETRKNSENNPINRKRETKKAEYVRKLRSKWRLHMREHNLNGPNTYLHTENVISHNNKNEISTNTIAKVSGLSLSSEEMQAAVQSNCEQNTQLDNLSLDKEVLNRNLAFSQISEGSRISINPHTNILSQLEQKTVSDQTINNNEANVNIKESSNKNIWDIKSQNEINKRPHIAGESNILNDKSNYNKPLDATNQEMKLSIKDQRVHKPQQKTSNLTEQINAERITNQLVVPNQTVSKNIQYNPNESGPLRSELRNVSVVYLTPIPLNTIAYITQEAVHISDSLKDLMPDKSVTSPSSFQTLDIHASHFISSKEKKADILSNVVPLNDNLPEGETKASAVQNTEMLNISNSITNKIVKIAQGSGSKQGLRNLNSIDFGLPRAEYLSNKGESIINENLNEQLPSHNKHEIINNSNMHKNINFRSIRSINQINSKSEKKGFNLGKHSGTIINADDISHILMSEIKGNNEQNEDKMSALKNGLTKVIVIQTKQKDSCPNEFGCEQMQRDAQCSDQKCTRTTPCLENFKEINEGYRKEDLVNFKDLYKENPKWKKECSDVPYPHLYTCPNMRLHTNSPCPHQTQQKKDKCESNSKELNNFGKTAVKKKRENSEQSIYKFNLNDEIVNFKDESNFDKGNKKIENKILEGFISSIIANYSKDESKTSTHEPGESNEKTDNGESLIYQFKGFTNKKNGEGSEKLNLVPLILPESRMSKYEDNFEYSKLGPFNEDEIKSLLQKNSIQLVQKQESNR